MSTKLGTLNKDQDMLLANDIAITTGTSDTKVASQKLAKTLAADAEANAKSYADGLATNYDAAGTATNAISTLLASLYPTNSLYITANNATKCPLETLIAGSSWQLVAKDSTIWGYDSANTKHTTKGLGGTLDAGLPLPTINDPGHEHECEIWSHGEFDPNIKKESGTDFAEPVVGSMVTSESTTGITIVEDSIYSSATTTVQPKAMLVNIWKRTA